MDWNLKFKSDNYKKKLTYIKYQLKKRISSGKGKELGCGDLGVICVSNRKENIEKPMTFKTPIFTRGLIIQSSIALFGGNL